MNQTSSLKGICKRRGVLLILSLFAVFLFSYSTSFAQTILFQDDFEDGNADGWQLDPGWQVEDDAGNFVLSGTGHSFARTGSMFWLNYSFKTKVKLMGDDSSAHLNYLNKGCERYFIGFNSGGLSLSKTAPCDTQTNLVSVNDPHDSNRWYTVKIVGDEGNIKVYVDGTLKIDYTDSDPLISGPISFETLDSHIHFDDVVVTTTKDKPLSQTSWVSTGGPLGGLGYDVRIHPTNKNIMYVTDNFAGVAKSDNTGQTWYQSNSGISIKSGPTGDAINIFSLTIDPNNPDIVWAGTNGEGSAFGVFKSIDGGASWTLKTNGITLGSDIGMVFRGFTIQKGNSNVVYAQAEILTSVQGLEFIRVKGRVYKTTDGGKSWRLIWEGDNLARYLIIDPDNPDVLYLSTGIFDREAYNSDCANGISGGVGVLKSTNGGKTWTPINNGLTDLYVGSLRMHPTNPQILLAGTGNNACSGLYTHNIVSGVFRTTDGGASWTKVIKDIITTVNFSPSNPNITYAGSSFAFYRSEDGGLTWSKFSKSGRGYGPPGIIAGFPIDVTIDPDNPYVLYANNYGGGVFRSTDGAQTWQVWSKGYTGADIKDVYIPANNSSTVYAVGRSGPFVSSNFGGDWVGIANGVGPFLELYSVVVHPTNSNVVLIADASQGVILRSIDWGWDFTEVFRHPGADASDPNKRQGFKTLVFSLSDPNVVYAGLARESANVFISFSPIGTVIYKSTDAGLSFSPMSSIINGHNVNELVVDPDNSNIVYAATKNGVYKSTNGATSWIHFDSLGNRQIEALAINPQQPGYIIAGESFGGIWISQNDGASWTGPRNSGINNPNPYISAIAVDPKNPDIVYAGDLYSGIYRSSDKGYTWSAFPDWKTSGLTNRAVKDIAINETVMYVATRGGGVFRYWRANLAPTPLSGDFGSIYVGSSSTPQTFTVTNTGNADLVIKMLSIIGTGASEFSIQNDKCSGQTLATSRNCTVEVVFSPTSAGAKSATLSITSNDPGTPTLNMPLSGFGFVRTTTITTTIPRVTTTVPPTTTIPVLPTTTTTIPPAKGPGINYSNTIFQVNDAEGFNVTMRNVEIISRNPLTGALETQSFDVGLEIRPVAGAGPFGMAFVLTDIRPASPGRPSSTKGATLDFTNVVIVSQGPEGTNIVLENLGVAIENPITRGRDFKSFRVGLQLGPLFNAPPFNFGFVVTFLEK